MTATGEGLVFDGITKAYGRTVALDDVSFAVQPGTVHALVGENGAGKSTLMRTLAGMVRPDRGHLRWRGAPLDCPTPREALDRGVGIVPQEPVLFPNLTVAENVFAGREPTDATGRIRRQEMRERTVAVLRDLHATLEPDAPVAHLGPAQQQLVQIARALAFTCHVLILDEPTTCLTDAEVAHLEAMLHRLRAQGVTMLYVSHRLAEVFRLSDGVTVLRDGKHVLTAPIGEVTPATVVRAMVGRELLLDQRRTDVAAADAPVALAVNGLTRGPWFSNISLSVRAGEIVGLFGLIGSGRTEVLETLFGLHPPDSGSVQLFGQPLAPRSPVDAIRAGMVLVPEARHSQGLFFNLDLRHNLQVSRAEAQDRWWIDATRERTEARGWMDAWRVKAESTDSPPDALSGGNQQKVLMAKWVATTPRVLLLDEPTRGVDVGAKAEIHRRIQQLATDGLACIVVSSDLPEVLTLADRVLVMREGRLQGELPGETATEEAVMHLATTEHHSTASSGSSAASSASSASSAV
jgi:ABC-type sugar transport system ATPase subunit